MPDVDGIEVIRNFADNGLESTLILISGLDERMLQTARRVAETRGLRVVGVLTKPFPLSNLAQLLRDALDTPLRSQENRMRVRALKLSLADLKRALELRQIVAHYQPQVRLRDRSWYGVEVLARWEHPEHGLLFPDAFIHMVEGSELASEFTFEIMRLALEGSEKLTQHSGFEGMVSVNVPARALSDLGFTDNLLNILHEKSFPPSRLTLELTETDIQREEEVMLDVLARLRMRGVNISIDDFGTGHSGFERLQNLPFNELKIDMVFIRDREADKTSHAIVQSAIGLGRSLAMTVVAEGVETGVMLDRLRDDGCDVVQGYYICRPGVIEHVLDWAKAAGGD